MTYYDKSIEKSLSLLSSDAKRGLTKKQVQSNLSRFGLNVLAKKKKKTFLSRFFNALKEPMLIILLFALAITFGANIGKFLRSGSGDFSECIGILVAVILSVSITLIMEGSSARAFETLNRIYDNIAVRVIREGKVYTISQKDVTVGDIILIESGDKIIADGRLIESVDLAVNESALTGESVPSKKDCNIITPLNTVLAERKNCVYSGTFVTSGNGKMLVTATGGDTEIGHIATELSIDNEVLSPLQLKLNKLGKIITTIGAISAVVVFIISVVRLILTGNFNFFNVQELFISCIVLIVAAVPEGLPTIVAVSLALNMIKLAKGNALIKKMTATETAGAVSVICSDKTGTLTQNKMKVVSVCLNQFCVMPKELASKPLLENFVCNSTADIVMENKKFVYKGGSTECALLDAYKKAEPKRDYNELRRIYKVVERIPFTSEKKYMSTAVSYGDKTRKYLKGAPEKVLDMCELTVAQKSKIINDMETHQKKSRRILCFAHLDYSDDKFSEKYVYDGFVSIADPIRKEVYKAVEDCKNAGIKVKILTGDNMVTALAVAKELKIATDASQVINAPDLEKLDDVALKKALERITVISRSTPDVKLRVVRALKSMGEVVAVTGDGINDAPAIKHADIGIAMGVSGSEITKEAASLVLLDDSFATVVKAIAFGRNVYKNLQRFILFQLSVNVSALLLITVCALLNLPTPFNTLQLLWINVIMDGPPALTLGLESAGQNIMSQKPVKRSESIVSKKMLLRIVFNGAFIGTIMLLQYCCNFIGVLESEKSNATFTLFILFQLFNAFNSRELGGESIFKNIGRNKVMVVTFIAVFIVHFIMVQLLFGVFGVSPLSLISLIKTILTASSIVLLSELYKLAYRITFRKRLHRK